MENLLAELRCRIDGLLRQKDRVLIAIDGSCTAGKTTLARMLEEEYDCNVFHMDDFFLRPEHRTPQRLAEPGGNVDYERFLQEVLLPLEAGTMLAYRPYDCSTGCLKEPVQVPLKKLNIIEGTYSHHPAFGSPYDLKVCLLVSPEIRRQRILARPAFLHRRFFEAWIPMEQQYFAAFSIAERSDIAAYPAEEG